MSTQTLDYRFRLRRRTAASWASLNEVLLDSEMGLESDTRQVKIGDGATPWNALAYFVGGRAGEPFALAGGTTDALTATFTPAITAPASGDQIKVRAALANATTTPTLAVDALAAAPITKLGGQALAVADIAGAGHELLLRYAAEAGRWELINPSAPAAGGGSATVQTVQISQVAGGGQLLGTVALGKVSRLLRFESDQPCRLRLYSTAAERSADLARSTTTDAAPGAGLSFEFLATASLLAANLAPMPHPFNGDTPRTSAIPFVLEPTSSAATTVTLTYMDIL